MTVIAAWSDGETAVIGGDSGAFDEGSAITTTNHKVWKAGSHHTLVGVSGSFRIMELVQESNLGEVHQIRDFLIAQSEKAGFPSAPDWGVIVAGLEGVWEIGSDFSVVKSSERYNAIGSGGLAALAAFHVLETLDDLSPQGRMKLVMAAAMYHTPYVRKPFKVIAL
jgi:ATP-dependent protease HslVU (ClpYQ) peptidase subunit